MGRNCSSASGLVMPSVSPGTTEMTLPMQLVHSWNVTKPELARVQAAAPARIAIRSLSENIPDGSENRYGTSNDCFTPARQSFPPQKVSAQVVPGSEQAVTVLVGHMRGTEASGPPSIDPGLPLVPPPSPPPVV